MPSSADMIRNLTDINNSLKNEFVGNLPDEKFPDKKKKAVNDLVSGLSNTQEISSKAKDTIEEGFKALENVSAKNYYNIIKKSQQIQQMQENEIPAINNIENTEDVNFSNNINDNSLSLDSVKLKDASDVRNKLESFSNVDEALSFFMPLVSDDLVQKEDNSGFKNPVNPRQVLSDSIKTYFENIGSMQDQEKIELSSIIFDVLPLSVKENNEGVVMEQKIANKIVKESNISLYNLAQKIYNDKENKTFNLSKQAQHKNFENMFLAGPENTKIDSLTGDLASDLHIIERNKGFGIKIDNILNIDYEALWRQNIMDKYSRPYKNKDGEWVGGYLNKRFEINQNVPVGNDYQLKPGQKRKPVLKQYGNLGSRMEYARDNNLLNPLSKESSSLSKESSTVFNFKKKIAQLKPLKDIPNIFDDNNKGFGISKTCPVCKSTNKAGNGKCENCGMSLNGVQVTRHKPEVPKKNIKNNTFASNIINKNLINKNKINNGLLLSDPYAENTDTDHLDNVSNSAEHLGM